MSYIEIEDLKKAMFELEPATFPSTCSAYESLLNYAVEKFSKEHKVAEWKLIEIDGANQWACGACHHVPHHRYWIEPRDNYCENCGAKMTRKDKDY